MQIIRENISHVKQISALLCEKEEKIAEGRGTAEDRTEWSETGTGIYAKRAASV